MSWNHLSAGSVLSTHTCRAPSGLASATRTGAGATPREMRTDTIGSVRSPSQVRVNTWYFDPVRGNRTSCRM